jgi:cobyrinic acid a,c-diamide synthase
VNRQCSRLVIAATGSGVGKTSLSLGVARMLSRRGLRVQTFKVGPDFLDPTHLALASGRTCYNLDGWMTSREYVSDLFARATADADVAIVEGVMGLFDGASPSTLEGSTAEIALWLDAPVVLVVNAHGAARSVAATVHGFAHFEPGLRLAGVIANHSGSARHRQWLAESLSAANLPPLLGAVPRDALPKLESRHLGLVAAEHGGITSAVIEQLADACQQHVDLIKPRPLVADSAVSAGGEIQVDSQRRARDQRSRLYGTRGVRIGVARDEAFHFYYPDNLEALEARGAELVDFSPLRDESLPDDLDAIYFGGGYPELHAERLSTNVSLRREVADFAASGRAVYAECGGLMYLSRSVQTLDGKRHPMAGVLPIDTAMLPRLSALGYVEATLEADCLWGAQGWTGRGHEFHYSQITADDSRAAGFLPAYRLARRRSDDRPCEGFLRGNVLASYVHLHWASRPEAVDHFLHRCKERA